MSYKHFVRAPGIFVLYGFLILLPLSGMAAGAEPSACLQDLLENGSDDMTLGEARQQCGYPLSVVDAEETKNAESSSFTRRMNEERAAGTRPFSILAHKPNYLLLGAYNQNGWNSTPYQQLGNDPDYENDDIESQFQVSLKVPLAVDLFNNRMDIYGAYTNRSFWQVYNNEYSEPFRETNHEPELWAQFRNDWQILGLTNEINTFGWVHQSNGRAGPISRSWNRLYASFIFRKDDYLVSFKPWVWISKDKEKSDNPDIDKFMGHGEIKFATDHKGHVFSGMIRNQFESGFDQGAIELSWSFPVFNYPYLKGYIQYFNGYGESLIDYDQKVNRIGLGISITDWLD